MAYVKKIRKSIWKWVIPIIIVCLFLYLVNVLLFTGKKVSHCSSSRHVDTNEVKYILNLERWYQLMNNDFNKHRTNTSAWCAIPSKIHSLSQLLCQMYGKGPCPLLPCHYIHSSSDTFEDIRCTHDGQKQKSANQPTDLLCKRSYSLDLLWKHSSYPSIIADPLTAFNPQLYRQILNDQYRSCDSIWGLDFNYESITNYPWTGERTNRELFDVTFGYDRNIYDFIPQPWLFNYIDRLKFTPNRRSMEDVMRRKKFIHSPSSSNLYWTNTPTRNDNQSSHIRSPIVWMNTNCHTPSRRTQYVHELMKHIDVDNYGTCGQKILPLPEHIIKIQNSQNKDLKDRGTYRWEQGKLALIEEYLFTIAIENSLTHDYITEKLWHPLITGSIPIYLGAESVNEWLPCQTDCIIDLRKFANAKEAAVFIKAVAQNETLYQSYHLWRKQPVKEQFQKMIDYFQRMDNFSMNCMMCSMAHGASRGENKQRLKQKFQSMLGRF